ncbi:MAG: MBOAT family protein [Planctomycetota bacterium]|nr:MBOAT family protein [Planctomycetota bacterium]
MLFHTWVFVVFFLIVYPVYVLIRRNNTAMNVWLMLASYVFYGWWNPWYLFLLFSTSAIDYLMVLFMERSRTPRGRRLWLIVSLVSNFGFLGYFKYSGFITDNLNALLAAAGLSIQLPDPVAYPNALLGVMGVSAAHHFVTVILPIGISFHTFQSMSYTIDAYKGNIKMERSFIRFLTFVSFFPQLVAGPIERARNLLPQLQSAPRITSQDITDGLSLVLVGFFKKVALADYLALYVDKVYAAPANFRAPALALATFAFAWQIYFDFSGYTDMARGIARVMGFRLMLNFNNPYVATSLGDFWNRWHISLSTWFKDYLYIPLGGNRHGTFSTYRNMFLTMVISGLWHGAAWTFVIWGALHALGRVLTRELERTAFYRDRIPALLKQLFVFAFVCLAWVFFRAQSVGDAWLVISRIFSSGWANPQFPIVMLVLVMSVWLYQFMYTSRAVLRPLLELSPVRVTTAMLMIAYLAIVAQPSTKAFIYFQF